MAKKNAFPLKRFLFICVILCILIAVAVYIRQFLFTYAPPPSPPAKVSAENEGILDDIAIWYPSAPWTNPAPAIFDGSYYGTMSGDHITATLTSSNASIPHFEDVKALAAKGFFPDTNLAADGPGSSTWGYKKNDNGNQQVIIFSYETQPTSSNPDEPLQFNCPCKVNLTAFVSTIWQGPPRIAM